jgi:hypothetical protein
MVVNDSGAPRLHSRAGKVCQPSKQGWKELMKPQGVDADLIQANKSLKTSTGVRFEVLHIQNETIVQSNWWAAPENQY